MRDDETAPISAQDAKELFAASKAVPAIVLAVSGGPDSIALMWLMARWRRGLSSGPRLVAVTVDHGLRPEAAGEARDVKRLAKALDLPHRTVRWTGDKPRTGVPAAARAARYRLLAEAARTCGATHIFTAHTRDDQAETLLMRLLRGSGIAGLSAMTRESVRNGMVLARPLLDVPKSRLIATLNKAQNEGDWHSIPGFITSRIGLGSGTITGIGGLLLGALFVLVSGLLVWRCYRGRIDWIAGAGWATVALLATATALLPWYMAWLLPLAALAGDRRLPQTAVAMSGFVLAIQLVGYIPHGNAILGL